MRAFPRRLSWILGSVTLIGIIIWASIPAPPIRVLTQYYPPYQYTDSEGRIVGSSVSMFRCAMEKMGEPYETTIVWGQGWAAGQDATAHGAFDGFYGALHTQERDAFARWSISLGDNHPYYIRRHETRVPRHSIDARWAVKKGSGISALVSGVALNVTFRGEDNPDVVAALVRDDADWLYMDIEIFRWSARVNQINDTHLFGWPDSSVTVDTEFFHMEPGPSQPYGVYWTYDFLRKRPPNWMDRFNAAISSCRQAGEVP